ncbi:hypothetical protein STEG23_019475, partial [Scotinomys teguina]
MHNAPLDWKHIYYGIEISRYLTCTAELVLTQERPFLLRRQTTGRHGVSSEVDHIYLIFIYKPQLQTEYEGEYERLSFWVWLIVLNMMLSISSLTSGTLAQRQQQRVERTPVLVSQDRRVETITENRNQLKCRVVEPSPNRDIYKTLLLLSKDLKKPADWERARFILLQRLRSVSLSPTAFTALPIHQLLQAARSGSREKLSHEKSHTELSFVYGNCGTRVRRMLGKRKAETGVAIQTQMKQHVEDTDELVSSSHQYSVNLALDPVPAQKR